MPDVDLITQLYVDLPISTVKNCFTTEELTVSITDLAEDKNRVYKHAAIVLGIGKVSSLKIEFTSA
jgi:hypothetical protein